MIGGIISGSNITFPLNIDSINIRTLTVSGFGLDMQESRVMHSCQYSLVGGEEMVVVAGIIYF